MDTTQTSLLLAVQDSANAEAWGSFYRIYASMVRSFARRLGLPDADADDVAQEVLMVAHRSLRDGGYDPAKGRFRQWLYGVTRRQALARRRERNRRTRAQWVSERGGVDLLDQLAGPDEDAQVQDLWHQEWRYALLDEALKYVEAQVGENTFAAFRLYAVERRPAEEVADRLGIARASVYVYKRRVLMAVRAWVARFEEE